MGKKGKASKAADPKPSSDQNIDYVIPVTPTILLKLFFHYFPSQISREIDFKKIGMTGSEHLTDGGEKIIDQIFKSSLYGLLNPYSLHIYGTASEIASQLKQFRTFAGSHEYFELSWTEPPNIEYLEYTEMPEDILWMPKQGVFNFVDCCLWRKYQNMPSLPRVAISLFLRLHERNLGPTYEIVQIKEDRRETLKKWDEFLAIIRENIANNTVPTTLKLSECDTLEKIYEHFRGYFEEFEEKDVEEPLKSAIREYMKLNDPRCEMKRLAEMYYISGEVIGKLKKMMLESKHLFLKYDKETNKQEQFVVRVFNQGAVTKNNYDNIGKGPDEFVMAVELYKALNDSGYKFDGNPSDMNSSMEFPQTFPYLITRETYPQIRYVDATIVPMRSRARPIRLHNGEYCVLAFDSFRHTYHDIMYGIRAYSRIPEDKVDEFEAALEKVFRDYYNADLATRNHAFAGRKGVLCRYFITEAKEKELKARVREVCEKYRTAGARGKTRETSVLEEANYGGAFVAKFQSLRDFITTQCHTESPQRRLPQPQRQ